MMLDELGMAWAPWKRGARAQMWGMHTLHSTRSHVRLPTAVLRALSSAGTAVAQGREEASAHPAFAIAITE